MSSEGIQIDKVIQERYAFQPINQSTIYRIKREMCALEYQDIIEGKADPARERAKLLLREYLGQCEAKS